MTWHYGIVRHGDSSLGLHEIYCDEAGRPNGYFPATFVANEEEGRAGIVGALEMALHDARERPIFDPGDTADAHGKAFLTLWLPDDLAAWIKAMGDDWPARVEAILQKAMDEGKP